MVIEVAASVLIPPTIARLDRGFSSPIVPDNWNWVEATVSLEGFNRSSDCIDPAAPNCTVPLPDVSSFVSAPRYKGRLILIKPVVVVVLMFVAKITLAPSLPGVGLKSTPEKVEVVPSGNALIVAIAPPFTSKATLLGVEPDLMPFSSNNSVSTEKVVVVAESIVTGACSRMYSDAK